MILLYIFLLLFNFANCSDEEEKLLKSLLKGYNKLIRPVRNSSDHVVITMDLVLLQLINVYEKEQIMKTNVWINLKWIDFQLLWSKNEFKVNSIRIPYERIWTPDIVLFNNADGNYEASYKSNAVVYSSAEHGSNILMVPPAIYKSSCTIDVTYFPFDEQQCEMRFGSWTFDANQVKLVREKPMANFDDYLPSGTWDVIDAPSETITYVIDGTERMELVYKFVIRRKTLFYTVNLIIPTVLISFLSIFVFYLPTDEGEKMTLCISILLALVVFLLLVSKILPPTSIVIPLIAKYLLFTFIMNIVTIFNTVIIINWNYRTPRTHNMPRWVRVVFMEFLPKILFMQRPKKESDVDLASFENPNNRLNNNKNVNALLTQTESENELLSQRSSRLYAPTQTTNSLTRAKNPHPATRPSVQQRQKQQQHQLLDNYMILKKKCTYDNTMTTPSAPPQLSGEKSVKFKRNAFRDSRNHDRKNNQQTNSQHSGNGVSHSCESDLNDELTTSNDEFTPEVLEAADKVAYITNHIKSENDYQEVRDDWKYVALVIDRLQLYIFFSVTVIGTVLILLRAPHIFEFVDQQKILNNIRKANNPY